MIHDTPLVSVLMTVYNREEYLQDAIQSIIDLKYQNWELIIVDDSSSDSSFKIAEKYSQEDNRIVCYRNEQNLGQFANRNYAASLAKGKYLKYFDSDDIIYAFALDILVEAMERFPAAAIAIASQDTHPTEELYPVLVESIDSYRSYFFNNSLLNIGPSGVMFRKERFIQAGGYTSEMATSDTELMLRIAARYPVVRVIPSFFYYRVHENQVLTKSNKAFVYSRESYLINRRALNEEYCPLTQSEIKDAHRILNKRLIKVAVYLIVKRLDVKYGMKLLKLYLKKDEKS